jgi:hypothetical protein
LINLSFSDELLKHLSHQTPGANAVPCGVDQLNACSTSASRISEVDFAGVPAVAFIGDLPARHRLRRQLNQKAPCAPASAAKIITPIAALIICSYPCMVAPTDI